MVGCTKHSCDDPRKRFPNAVRNSARHQQMRIAFLLFLLAGTVCARAGDVVELLPRTQLYGRDYVRITDWAKAKKLELHWMTRDRELRATNATSKLYFTMDSRFATFNGIRLVLSCPVILQKEKIYISVVDLQATVHPILYPEKMQAGTFIKTICLDAGHGGKDPGKLDGKNHEKRYTLLLAEEVERGLKEAGFKVVQTRTRDLWLDLPDRAKIANKEAADLFVSLHYNAAGNVHARGTEVYCLTPAGTTSSNADRGHPAAPVFTGSSQSAKSVLLAYQLQKSLVMNLNVEDRGVKRAQFLVLTEATMPAILIEAGFMTNPTEANRIYDSAYRKKMARAIVGGILNYKKVVEQ